MPERHENEECSRIHLNWLAIGSVVAVLALVFSIMGWLLNNAAHDSNISTRLDAVETSVAGLQKSHNEVVLPSLARIEQSLTDMNHRFDTMRDLELRDHPRSAVDPPNPNFVESLKKPVKKDTSTNALKK
jgi:hypothetical protein